MKTMKKITSLALALALVLTMSVGVFADDTVTLKINGTAGHTYEAYQIFAGTLGTDGNLGNITWGNGLLDAEATFGKATEVAATLKTSADIEAKAYEFAKKLNAANKVELLEADNWTKTVPNGYYLIQEADVPAGEVGTKYVVAVVKDTVIEPKVTSDVTFEKKIMDVNDTTEAALTEANTLNAKDPKWKDSADYDIGDTVPFKLSAKVASDASKYAGPYKLEFVDQLSPELTPVLENGVLKVVVKVGDTVIDSSNYTVTETTINGATAFKVTFADVNKVAGISDGDIVNVFLSATLNEDAKIGATADNLNKAKLVYSNNPTSTQEGDDVPTGETPWDTVRVFTYKFVANKIDGADKTALEGAGFTLFKVLVDKTEQEVKKYEAGTATTFEFKGLDDGNYILRETETPAGYNTIEDIKFTITATHEEEAADPSLGEVKFTNTEDGTELHEGAEYTMDVENNKGLTLPETGGMGTTILYLLGAMLAIGAAVILVSKKIAGQK